MHSRKFSRKRLLSIAGGISFSELMFQAVGERDGHIGKITEFLAFGIIASERESLARKQ